VSEEPRLFFASSDEPRMLSKANDYKTVKSAAMRAMLCGLWAAKLPSLCAVGWLHSRVGVCVHGCVCMHARVRERHPSVLVRVVASGTRGAQYSLRTERSLCRLEIARNGPVVAIIPCSTDLLRFACTAHSGRLTAHARTHRGTHLRRSNTQP
jgi:hypothetical protein